MEIMQFKEIYSNQVWSEQWRWQWYRQFTNRCKAGYTEVDEHDNSRLWTEINVSRR